MDWIAFTILCVMVLITSFAVIATDWSGHLDLIVIVSMLGAWAGTALGRSRFPAWLASIFAAAYGTFVCGWQLGLTLDRALPWVARFGLLNGRLNVFFSKIMAGERNEDAFIFVMLMSVVFWVMSVWSGWSVFRRYAAWPTILSNGLTIVIVTYFYYGPARLGYFLAIFSLAALILAARLDIFSRYIQWEHQRARVQIDTVYQVSVTALIASFLLVALAWGGPAFAKSEVLSSTWRAVTRPFDTVKEKFEDAFDPIEGATRVIPSEYGKILSLTTGTEPIERQVMTVDPLDVPSLGGRFYWRSRIYDEYLGNQWTGPTTQTEEFNPREGQLILGEYVGREFIEVNVAPTGAAIRLLYLPSQPVWVDRTSGIVLMRHEDDSLDVASIESNHFIYEGESYRAIASLAVPSAEQLRAAGENYPEWVLDRNLQLPDSVTQRTRDLAADITRGLQTPYDKTVAITRWLRTNIEYERVIEAPPPEREPIDWFLFDYKIGFCNYYASAEVVLLRSLGIPARMGAGYARGDYNITEQVYIVEGEDSHAWPEVFFPGIGWVEFEPTVSQPILTRPDEGEGGIPDVIAGPDDPLALQDQLEEPVATDELTTTPVPNFLARTLMRILGFVFLLGSIVFLSWIRINPAAWAAMRVRLNRIAQRLGLELAPALEIQEWEWDTSTGRIYASWSAWLRRLELSEGPWETPRERATTLAKALPESADSGWTLVNAYMRERFAGVSPNIVLVRRAWNELRPQLWRAWLRKLTERWRREN